jgi:hypothetical protein
MMSEKKRLVLDLAESLERLHEMKPTNKHDLQSWYATARGIEKQLVSANGLSPEVPEFLWHYLADADIRLKDPSYGELQVRKLILLIQYLKRGEVPTDAEIAKYFCDR